MQRHSQLILRTPQPLRGQQPLHHKTSAISSPCMSPCSYSYGFLHIVCPIRPSYRWESTICITLSHWRQAATCSIVNRRNRFTGDSCRLHDCCSPLCASITYVVQRHHESKNIRWRSFWYNGSRLRIRFGYKLQALNSASNSSLDVWIPRKTTLYWTDTNLTHEIYNFLVSPAQTVLTLCAYHRTAQTRCSLSISFMRSFKTYNA
jgi:hypothetical protein